MYWKINANKVTFITHIVSMITWVCVNLNSHFTYGTYTYLFSQIINACKLDKNMGENYNY